MRRPDPKAVDELGSIYDRLWEFRQGDEGAALPECAAFVLVYLARQPDGSALLAEVHERLELSDWEKGRGCQAIERAGLLQITRTIKDGRAKRLTLTASGYRLIDHLGLKKRPQR